MGESINDVKIGTCENLYYVTFEGLKKFSGRKKDQYLKLDSGNRFRFPFPDENNKTPYIHDNYDRGFLLFFPKEIPAEISHNTVFIRQDIQPGYSYGVSIPCPYSEQCLSGVRIWNHENETALEIVQQKFVTTFGKPQLVTVCRCPICKNRAMMEEAEIQAIYDYYVQCSNYSEENKKYLEETLQILQIALDGYNIDLEKNKMYL